MKLFKVKYDKWWMCLSPKYRKHKRVLNDYINSPDILVRFADTVKDWKMTEYTIDKE